MSPAHRSQRRAIRNFLQTHYSEQHLVSLIAHCQDGKFYYYSCCCLIGIPTADHALRGENLDYDQESHYIQVCWDSEAREASVALGYIASTDTRQKNDAKRRRILVPMARAELRRRERLRSAATPAMPAPAVHQLA